MRTVVCSLLLGALAAGGCWPMVPFPTLLDSPPPALAAPPAPRPPVTPEQVHAGNAREMVQALWDEVEREQAAAKK